MPKLSSARPRNLGSINNPCTLSSEEDSEVDQLDSEDGDYAPGDRRRKKIRKRSSTGRTSRRSTMAEGSSKPSITPARVLTPEIIEDEEEEAEEESMDADEYRQPRCLMIPNVKQDPTWKEAYANLMSILESGTMDKTALKLARKARKRLLDEDVEWGIVEKGSDSNAGGRCVACAKRKQDCVVQLGQPSARGGPFEIISRCIRCIVSASPCDLSLHYDSDLHVEPVIPIKPATLKTTQINVKPLSQTPVSQVKDRSSPKVDESRKVVVSQSGKRPEQPLPAQAPINKAKIPKVAAPAPLMAPPSPPVLPRGRANNVSGRISTGSEVQAAKVDKSSVLAAISDIGEFTEDMRQRSSTAEGRMDIGTRGMFTLVDAQMAVLRRFAEQLP